MNLNITEPEEILRELRETDAFLQIECSEQIEEVVERGNTLAVYIARSGKLLADARHHLNGRMKSEVFETLKTVSRQAGATSKATNAIIDSLCRDEQYLADWCERTNRAATHQLDWCRTLVSKAKAEMSITPPAYNTKYQPF
jgi:hypothetical protein